MTEDSNFEAIQKINATIAIEKAISSSLLFSLERQHLINIPFREVNYIQAVKGEIPEHGEPYLLQLKEINDSIVTSLQEKSKIMQATLSACHQPGEDKLVFIISKNETKNHVFLGSNSLKANFVTDIKYFLEGNWPGTQLNFCYYRDNHYKTHIEKAMQSFNSAASLTGIPSLNPVIHSGYSQIDRLLGSMGSESQFIYMVIAEPMAENEVNEIIYKLRELKAWLSFLKKEVISNNILDTKILNRTEQSESRDQNIGNSKVDTKSSNLNIDIIQLIVPILKYFPPFQFIAGIEPVLTKALKSKLGVENKETTTTKNTNQENIKSSNAYESTDSQLLTFKQTYIDAQVQASEKLIEQYIERFETNRALGFWNVGVYFLAQNSDIVQRGGKFLKALLSEGKSGLEPIRIHKNIEDVSKQDGSQPESGILNMLRKFEQPSLKIFNQQDPQLNFNHPLGSVFNGLTTPLTTEELSMFINLPSQNYLK